MIQNATVRDSHKAHDEAVAPYQKNFSETKDYSRIQWNTPDFLARGLARGHVMRVLSRR